MANLRPGTTQVGMVLTVERAQWLRIEAVRTGRTLGEVVESYLPTVEAERAADRARELG